MYSESVFYGGQLNRRILKNYSFVRVSSYKYQVKNENIDSLTTVESTSRELASSC